MMSEIYCILVYFLGEPPEQFNWEYKTKQIKKGGKTKKINNKKKKTKRKKLTFKHVKKVILPKDYHLQILLLKSFINITCL